MLAYLDTSIWILRTEGIHPYRQKIEDRLDRLSIEGWSFCASQVVMLEVLYKPYKDNNTSLVVLYETILQNTLNLPNYAEIFTDSLKVMRLEGLKTADSIHVALAQHYNCDLFVSTDHHFKNLVSLRPLLIDLSQKT